MAKKTTFDQETFINYIKAAVEKGQMPSAGTTCQYATLCTLRDALIADQGEESAPALREFFKAYWASLAQAKTTAGFACNASAAAKAAGFKEAAKASTLDLD